MTVILMFLSQQPPRTSRQLRHRQHETAELLLLVGDNPERIRSEGAFAKLCGACPIPASSGRTTATG